MVAMLSIVGEEGVQTRTASMQHGARSSNSSLNAVLEACEHGLLLVMMFSNKVQELCILIAKLGGCLWSYSLHIISVLCNSMTYRGKLFRYM